MNTQVYLWLATIVTLWGCLNVDTKRQGKIDGFIGSVIVAISLGWLIWPLALLAGVKDRKHRSEVAKIASKL